MSDSKNIKEILPGGFSFEMIFVEGGAFLMGSQEDEANGDEKPIHEVKLDGFYMGEFPVTQGLWKSVMKGDNPSFFRGDERPVEQVSWEDAQEFITALNDQTGRSYRLPTEAEWEYGARGGAQSRGYLYAGGNKLKEVGWYNENSHGETQPVGMKIPNELGLYEMSGNVLEWCQDWFAEKYYEGLHKWGMVTNPGGPESGTGRVLRGGSWFATPRGCRCTRRDADHLGFRYRTYGFRLVLSLQ